MCLPEDHEQLNSWAYVLVCESQWKHWLIAAVEQCEDFTHHPANFIRMTTWYYMTILVVDTIVSCCQVLLMWNLLHNASFMFVWFQLTTNSLIFWLPAGGSTLERIQQIELEISRTQKNKAILCSCRVSCGFKVSNVFSYLDVWWCILWHTVIHYLQVNNAQIWNECKYTGSRSM